MNTHKYIFSKGIDEYLTDVQKAYQFTLRFFKEVFKKPFHLQEIVNQCFEVGIRSVTLIALTGFIVGTVFTKQSRGPLEEFGATSWLPSLMGIAMVKALGPLVTALICAGKVGSSIGAELGSMKVTEQIEAMEVSAINPFKYLVVTRVLATTIAVPVLAMFCSFIGLYGSYLNVHVEETSSMLTFYQNAFSTISFLDVFSSLGKSIVYGFTIGMVGSYKGFYASQGTRGVGKAANHAVVLAMFLIFIEEIIIVQISNWIRFY
jgi:phospholipid/cholesterol/gamma-HCH transport system permease protein